MMAEVGVTDAAEGFRKARHDAEQAIGIDPTSASGYLALAETQVDCDWDWSAAITSVAKAADLEPGSAEVFSIRSYLSRLSGDVDQAIELKEKAVTLDPLRTDSHSTLGYLLYVGGRYDEARSELQKALALNQPAAFVHLTLGKILIAEGKPQQALAEIEKEPLEWGKLTGKALAYHALGREHDSNDSLAGLIAKYSTDADYQMAQVYAYRGQSDKSFEWLERAYKQRDAGLPDIKTDPLLKNLRRDPRYAEFLKKMRLPVLDEEN
jgi:tetratricopeptide (TPR) repeat protein